MIQNKLAFRAWNIFGNFSLVELNLVLWRNPHSLQSFVCWSLEEMNNNNWEMQQIDLN